jgi:hypothetical protein
VKLTIVSVGLSAALIDKAKKGRSVEVLVKFEHHQPILAVPKGTYEPSESASARKYDSFDALLKVLHRQLAEAYFDTHDLFDVSDYDLIVDGDRTKKDLDIKDHAHSGDCNRRWDWSSTKWMANISDISEEAYKIDRDELERGAHVGATLAIAAGEIRGYRPVEPLLFPPRRRVLGKKNQRFTDAMRWSSSYDREAKLIWNPRKAAAQVTLTFAEKAVVECVLLNLPVPGHRLGSHFSAFATLPLKPRLEVDEPGAGDLCGVMRADEHDSHAPATTDVVRVTAEAPGEWLREHDAVVTFSVRSGEQGHAGRTPKGDSLCMRLMGNVDFD